MSDSTVYAEKTILYNPTTNVLKMSDGENPFDDLPEVSMDYSVARNKVGAATESSIGLCDLYRDSEGYLCQPYTESEGE